MTIVGRGNEAGAQLFRQWFEGLTAAANEGRGAAYVFVMGSLCELLRVFDFPIVFPEINYDQIDQIWGMDIVVCTTARTNDEARALLKEFDFPFRN